MKQNIFLQVYYKNYLVFISANKCFKFLTGSTGFYSWKSKRTSEESIENITTSNNFFA